MLALLSSEIVALAMVILGAAVLGWIACLRAQVHRQCLRREDRVAQLSALPSQWCISAGTLLGCL